MTNAIALSVSKINTTDTVSATPAAASVNVVKISRESTKDAGRVHVGGGMMRF